MPALLQHRPRMRAFEPPAPVRRQRINPLYPVVAALWVVEAVLAFAAPAILDAAWRTISGLPTGLQVVAWFALLPYLVAYMAWTAPWDLWLRVLSVVVLAVLTLWTFATHRRDGY